MEEANQLDKLREALGSQYDVERVLGHGGMGMVVLGRDRALHRPVAIKVISPDIDVMARHRQRFLQEARIVANLRHPNIVAVYTAGDANGLLYFVMEFVPGESLRDLLTRDRCCTPGRAERILRDLADALAFAHARGVVHRDIKPENVLLDHDTGRAMLADFGVAQALAADGRERLTGPGVVVGSPQYMSPEQAAGERELDGRSDIYALGLIGYEMLAGSPAFEGPSVVAILTKQLTEPPPPLEPLAPGASPTLVAVITRAIEKEAENRWQDAGEMARAIAGEIPVPPPVERDAESAVRTAVAPPTVERVATPLPEQPPQRPFVGPGRRPGRSGRARRFATWLASASAVLLFVAPISWLATAKPRRAIPQDTVALPFVAPLETRNVDSAIGLARRSGARTVVMGETRAEGDSVVVVATTYDVATGAIIGQVQRRATVGADPRALLDTLVRSLPPNPTGQAGQLRQNNP
jgi:eukaryotic-like serine/threonine-protein kinase